jgi:hypothetical protein
MKMLAQKKGSRQRWVGAVGINSPRSRHWPGLALRKCLQTKDLEKSEKSLSAF